MPFRVPAGRRGSSVARRVRGAGPPGRGRPGRPEPGAGPARRGGGRQDRAARATSADAPTGAASRGRRASSPRWSSPFAGLHQLCAPLLDRLDAAAGAAARCAAHGVRAERRRRRRTASWSVWRCSACSPTRPRSSRCCASSTTRSGSTASSAQTLAFVARRLLAEPVALVFARPRDRRTTTSSPACRSSRSAGSADADARALLDSAIRGPLDERVRDRIVAEARGNPLALLELPRGLTPAELAGGFGLPGAMPLASRIEQGFLRRLESLPRETRRLLLLAAAEPVGDATLLWRAAEQLGIAAGRGGAGRGGGSDRDRRPGAVPPSAGALGGLPGGDAPASGGTRTGRWPRRPTRSVDPDRRAWHRAHAAAGAGRGGRRRARALGRPGAGPRRPRRGGRVPERAAALTPDPARRGAARAGRGAGQARGGRARTPRSSCWRPPRRGPLDELQRARLGPAARPDRVRARARGSDAPPLLLDAARRLEPLDPALARETYLEALGAAIFAGRLARGPGVPRGRRGRPRRAAGAGAAALDRPAPRRPGARFTDGLRARACRRCGRRSQAFRDERSATTRTTMRWLWLAGRRSRRLELWDDERVARARHARGAARARDRRARRARRRAQLSRRACTCSPASSTAAAALIEEADAITDATGNARPRLRRARCSPPGAATRPRRTELIDASRRERDGAGRGTGARAGATTRRAVLYNGLGRYEAALAARRAGVRATTTWAYAGWALVELVEAAARSGRPERRRRRAATGSTSARAPRGTDWALGIAGPLAGAAQRGRRRRRALPRGDRAARAHPDPRRARPRAPALRRVAAPRAAARRRARAAARRARAVRARWAPRRSPSAPAASCWPPARRCASARVDDARRAHRRRRRRSPGWPRDGQHQPGDRRAAVHQPAHRRVPPAQGVRASSTSARARSSARRCRTSRRRSRSRSPRPGTPGTARGSRLGGRTEARGAERRRCCPKRPPEKGPLMRPNHRPRPRRLRRVGELGPRHRASCRTPATTSIAAANPLRGLASDAAAVSDLVRTIDGPVLLVGHSYGGTVITNVDADAGEITGLVYVAGFAPEPGESAFTLSRRFPGSTLGDALQPVPRSDGTTDLYIAPRALPRAVLRRRARRRGGRMAATQRPVTLRGAAGAARATSPLWKELPSWFLFGEAGPQHPRRAPALHGQARRGAPHGRDPQRLARRRPSRTRDATARLILEAAAPRARRGLTRRRARCPSTTRSRRSCSSRPRRRSPRRPPSRRSCTSSPPTRRARCSTTCRPRRSTSCPSTSAGSRCPPRSATCASGSSGRRRRRARSR